MSSRTFGSMTIETSSFENIHFRPVHLRPHSHETSSFKTTFICDFSFETFIWVLFICDFSLETFIWGFHLRPHLHENFFHLRSHSFVITFILRRGRVKLFWFSVCYIFMICLPLLYGKPKALQGYALPCPGATHAGL